MRIIAIRVFFVSWLISLCLAFTATTAFGQCGANGTLPCRVVPKTTPKKAVPKKVAPKKTISKTTAPNIKSDSKVATEKGGKNTGNTKRFSAVKKSQSVQKQTSAESSGNHLVILTGKCRLQLVEGFFPCDSKVLFAQLANGRSLLTFIKHEKDKEYLFTLSGGTDRQPNLENYYLGIDTFRIKIGDADEISDDGMEGECHFRMNKTATDFYSVKCDIYNRPKGTLYNFYLENITKTDHEDF